MDVYEKCRSLKSDRFLLLLVRQEDAEDFLHVYSDRNTLPFFNSDNCHGDNFFIRILKECRKPLLSGLSPVRNVTLSDGRSWTKPEKLLSVQLRNFIATQMMHSIIAVG